MWGPPSGGAEAPPFLGLFQHPARATDRTCGPWAAVFAASVSLLGFGEAQVLRRLSQNGTYLTRWPFALPLPRGVPLEFRLWKTPALAQD